MRYRILTIALFLFSVQYNVFSQKTITLESLLKDMVNRDALAKFPSPDYTCKQFSSYDQNSVSPEQDSWFANSDNNYFIRVEKERGRTEFVMLDAEGPGAIVRFWATFNVNRRGNGILRFYIDGETTPAIEGDIMDIISGKGLVDGPLASSVSTLSPYKERGHNLYLPIPYSKSCKITYESLDVAEHEGRLVPGNETVYYNINYRTYEPGAKVVSFTRSQLTKYSNTLRDVQKQLTEMSRGTNQGLKSVALDSGLEPGANKSLEIKGSNAIRNISLSIKGDGDREQALRSTVIEIEFDGNRTVWVPAGDFFGISYHQVYTNTWYTNCTTDGQMNSFWVMPFKNSCKFTIHNYGDKHVDISGAVKYGKWAWDNNSMHFGANWQQFSQIESRNKDKNIAGEHKDLNFTTIHGKGVYVGDGISIFNTTNAWWGEGDEKIYVDGEKFPSHFGTGTEDYYGYAWCRPEVFTDHPYIAQPKGDGSFNPAASVNTRLRALDAIPFRQSIKMDLELWHWASCIMNYSPVTFWYVIPGGNSIIKENIEEVKKPVIKRRSQLTTEGLRNIEIQGESMVVTGNNNGQTSYQYDTRWNNFSQIWWHNIDKTGSRLELTFVTGTAGVSYYMSGDFTVAPDYGTFNIYLNGELVGKDINLFNRRGVSVRNVDMGEVLLKEGVNTLTVELTEITPDRTNCHFGIDRLIFKE